MEDLPAVWMRLRIGVAAVGVIVGLSVFTVFGVHYNNWNAAGWGLMSGVIALITLTVHIYSTRGLSQKDERKLKTLMLMGCFFQLMGVCGFTVYLTLAIVSNQGLQIYDDGYYLTLVWCFMTWKWGFSLFYYSRTYRRSLGITTLINQ